MRSLPRRQFLQGSLTLAGLSLGSACGALPLPWQPPPKVPRIGYLASGSRDEPNVAAFLLGLRDLGYIEGQNILIEWRFAEGRDELLPQFAAELLALPVELILSSGPGPTVVARKATATLPVVMCFGGDPIALGLITSLPRPGGNVTGLAALSAELAAKRLQLLTEALPAVQQVAVLWETSTGPFGRGALEVAAQALQLRLHHLEIRGPDELRDAFSTAVAGRADALAVMEGSMFSAHRQEIVDEAQQRRLPTATVSRNFAEAGALLTYGARFATIYRRAASYVDKILKGTSPADLPVEQPTEFDFIINLRTAQTLGLVIPPSVLAQATEIIQ
jgi:ABC-type uncharacterized transport system substrate-binding protein